MNEKSPTWFSSNWPIETVDVDLELDKKDNKKYDYYAYTDEWRKIKKNNTKTTLSLHNTPPTSLLINPPALLKKLPEASEAHPRPTPRLLMFLLIYDLSNYFFSEKFIRAYGHGISLFYVNCWSIDFVELTSTEVHYNKTNKLAAVRLT